MFGGIVSEMGDVRELGSHRASSAAKCLLRISRRDFAPMSASISRDMDHLRESFALAVDESSSLTKIIGVSALIPVLRTR